MKKLLIPLLILLLFSVFVFSYVGRDDQIKVGIFYYVWYDEGFGNRHWNDTIYTIVVDEPYYYSYYSSQNKTHLAKQIDLIADLGVDFIIISWWGNNSYEDNSTKILLEVLSEKNFPIKFCIMVEPYTDNPNYTFIYNYIYENYVELYKDCYFKWEGKYLLCWFNPLNPPKNDSRFTDRVVGHENYVDWSLWNKKDDMKISVDGEVTVCPRYDDYYLYKYGGRETYERHDVNYTEGMYQAEWDYVFDNIKDVKLVLIYSWNEYHERSMTEPHKDVSNPDIFLAYSQTKNYIQNLKAYSGLTIETFLKILIPLAFFVIVIYFFIIKPLMRRERVSRTLPKKCVEWLNKKVKARIYANKSMR